MYVLQDKPKETLDALLKATPIVEKTGDDYTEFCYNFVFAKYYYLIGMYERALNIIDKNKLTEEDIRNLGAEKSRYSKHWDVIKKRSHLVEKL